MQFIFHKSKYILRNTRKSKTQRYIILCFAATSSAININASICWDICFKHVWHVYPNATDEYCTSPQEVSPVQRNFSGSKETSPVQINFSGSKETSLVQRNFSGFGKTFSFGVHSVHFSADKGHKFIIQRGA